MLSGSARVSHHLSATCWVLAAPLAFVAAAGCSPDFSLLDEPSFGGAADENLDGDSGGARGNIGQHEGGKVQGTAGASSVANAPSAGGYAGAQDAGPSGAAGEGGTIDVAPVPQCVPAASETCNSLDDDCNGLVDEQCAGQVTVTFDKDLPLIGDSPGGSLFSDDCKAGEVLAGLHVAMGAFLSQARGVCRKLSLETDTTAALGYRIRLLGERALPAHPESSSDELSPLACPQDQALVGLRLAQQHYALDPTTSVPVTTRVWLSCAKLELARTDQSLSVTWSASTEQGPVSGSFANGMAYFVSASAPQGLFASRLLGASGSWVDRLGFGVSRLGIELK